MKSHRPKNLNLFTIRFPIIAIVSILHRISGVMLFLLTPVLLWLLDYSLRSEEAFTTLHQFFLQPIMKFFILGALIPFFFHFIAGLRHLLLDFNIGVELKSGRVAAYITIFLTIIFIVIAGYFMW